MLPPQHLAVPAGTVAVYAFAVSILKDKSEVDVSWTDGSATFGQKFFGPSESLVLGDQIFNLPLLAIENSSLPSEILVSFNFFGGMTGQPTVLQPVTESVGPEGDATQIQITGYSATDTQRQYPTTLTVFFQGILHMRNLLRSSQ
jgi:hypothetical protein